MQRPVGSFFDRNAFDLVTLASERDDARIKSGAGGRGSRRSCDGC